MLEALLTWQSAVLVAVLALCVVFQRQRPSRHALLALVCYGLSVALFNAWVFVPSSADPAQNQWLLDYAYKVFNAGVNGALVVYLAAGVYFLFDPADKDDLPAKLLWICVLFAEMFGLLVNNVTCNLILEAASRAEIAETWGTDASKYVCGREVGEWLEWVPITLQAGAMAWLVQRWTVARELGKS